MTKRIAAILLLLVAGCGSVPKPGIDRAEQTGTSAAQGGGYYLDDGPGDRPPADIDAVPDARPKTEPLNRYTNRPYVALGKMYIPQTQLGGYKARGVASWYGRRFHGKKTATGEIYDMYGMTAAHTTLPIPSYARVTNLKNGKSVTVRINDRGPFHADRIIDLSYTAASRLGLIGAGSGEVEVESIVPGATETVQRETAAAAPLPVPKQEPPAMPLSSESGGVYLQLGAFSARDNAENFSARLRNELADFGAKLGILAESDLFRVRLGPFVDPETARLAAGKIQQQLNLKPMLIVK